MRSLTLIGILLTGLGGFILFRGLTYSSQRSVLKLGDFEATLEEKRCPGLARWSRARWRPGLALGGRPTGTWPVAPNERIPLSGRPQLMRGVFGGPHQHSAVLLGRVGWI